MKLRTVAFFAVLFSAGYALAGAGAPVPEGSQTAPPSGRPSKVLSDADCQTVWKMASPAGDTLSQGKATPFDRAKWFRLAVGIFDLGYKAADGKDREISIAFVTPGLAKKEALAP
jgi:hypothetical protein